jgi:hypothetical protein
MRGEVFFFDERALILRKEREYVLLNITKHEELKITVLERNNNGLKEQVQGELVRPSDILAIILD